MPRDSGYRTELVVFDLGGTTVHDDGAILRVFLASAEAEGLPTSAEHVEALQGLTKREIFHLIARELHPDNPDAGREHADRANMLYERELLRHYAEAPIELVQGTIETFGFLRDRCIKIAITTGFWRAALDLILERTNLNGLVDFSIATDEVRQGKPAPYMIFHAMEACGVRSVKNVVAVGDTPMDCIAGCNAGCGKVIGVLTGTHSRLSLERVPHNYIIDSAARVRELFETGRIR